MGVDSEKVTSCQKVLYSTLGGLKAESIQLVLKGGAIKIHKVIDFSPAPVGPLSALAHKQDDTERSYWFSHDIFSDAFS